MARPRPDVRLSADEVALVRSLVIHQDEHVLALNKPAGLSSQGGRGQVNTLDEMLTAFAKPSGRRPMLVHRLDRDTSGVILARGASRRPASSEGGHGSAGSRRDTWPSSRRGPPEPAEGEVAVALRAWSRGGRRTPRPARRTTPTPRRA
jgi:tRNA pseudouridine32 synthase/23S rRNA pseudouridine746 synthase